MLTLRFHDFTESWVTCDLGSLTKIYDGTHQTPKYVKSGVPFYSVEHVTADQFDKTKFISETVFENESKRANVEKGDILMTRIGSIGVSKYIDWEVRASFYVSLALIKKSNKIDGRYLNSAIQSETFQRELWKRAIHAAFPQKINLGEISHCKIHVPKIEEQQKIAAFLSSVDTKIEQLNRKKALLEQYKKGMMQKLFSQEIRFKDEQGKEYPDWEKKKVSEVFRITRGNVLAVNQLTACLESDHIYPVFSSQTKNNGLMGYYTDYLYENAITWTTDGANAGEVKYRDGKFYCTNVCGVLLSKEGFANQCASEMLNRITKKYVSYVGNPKLMNNVMAIIKIYFPCIEEQQKIAAFLSSIDKKIDLVAKQLQQAQTFKKGLLQQMFV